MDPFEKLTSQMVLTLCEQLLESSGEALAKATTDAECEALADQTMETAKAKCRELVSTMPKEALEEFVFEHFFTTTAEHVTVGQMLAHMGGKHREFLIKTIEKSKTLLAADGEGVVTE